MEMTLSAVAQLRTSSIEVQVMTALMGTVIRTVTAAGQTLVGVSELGGN
jgi:Na+/serine symporter